MTNSIVNGNNNGVGTRSDGDATGRDTSRLTEPRQLVQRAAVTVAAIDAAEHASLVDCPESGAVVTFAGVIRNHDRGHPVVAIDYVAHPSATDEIGRVAAEIASTHAVDGVAVTHRLGPLTVGDVALAAAVSAAHRHEAFAALTALIDQIKAEVPIWKHQTYADGHKEWVGCPTAAHSSDQPST